jgi:capsular polysaccharide biosynthesis protein/Mrp family chromosome partitioning ATPase
MDVRDVGVALWRQRPLVVLILVITGSAVAAGIFLAPKTYAATATISAAEQPGVAAADDPDALRATLAELANSRGVVDEVRGRIPTDRSVAELRRSIQGDWVRGTILVDITVRDRDPDTAAAIANAATAVLVDGDVVGDVAGPSLGHSLVLTISDPAQAPDTFSSPDLRISVGLGVLLALGLATSAAVWRDRRTHTLDDAAAVEEAATAPLLAHLTPPKDLTTMPALHPGTGEADLFRHLRLALETQAGAGSPRVVVAGITHGDVNVWIGANVALALAGTGQRVLLVDGRMGDRFGTPVEDAPDTPGLYDVLLGADLETAMSPGPVDLLEVLPAGRYGDTKVSELIEQRFVTVMESAAPEFDHVVVIGPPLDACEDSRAMAVDSSIVLALVEGSVSANALRQHADRIRAAGARLLGVVLVAKHSDRSAA